MLAPWFRAAHARGDPEQLRRDGRLLGTLSNLPTDGGRGPALFDPEPAVLDARTARDRQLPGARISAPVFGRGARAPRRAPRLGEHTDQVLSDLLGLSDGQIGALRDRRVIAGPIEID